MYKKVASAFMKKAGWWEINVKGKSVSKKQKHPLVKEKEERDINDPTYFLNGDSVLDLISDCVGKIDMEYRLAIGRPVRYEELKHLFEVELKIFHKHPKNEWMDWIDEAVYPHKINELVCEGLFTFDEIEEWHKELRRQRSESFAKAYNIANRGKGNVIKNLEHDEREKVLKEDFIAQVRSDLRWKRDRIKKQYVRYYVARD